MNFEGIEKVESFEGKRNCYFLITDEFINFLGVQNQSFNNPKFYSEHFTIDNNALFEFIQHLDIYNLIQTMTEMPESEFKNLLEEVNKFNVSKF